MGKKIVDYVLKKQDPYRYHRQVLTEVTLWLTPASGTVYKFIDFDNKKIAVSYVDIRNCPVCTHRIRREGTYLSDLYVDKASIYCPNCLVKINVHIKDKNTHLEIPNEKWYQDNTRLWRIQYYSHRHPMDPYRLTQEGQGKIEKEFRTNPTANNFFPEPHQNMGWRVAIQDANKSLGEQIKELDNDNTVAEYNINCVTGKVTDVKGFEMKNRKELTLNDICEMAGADYAIDHDTDKIYFRHRENFNDKNLPEHIREIFTNKSISNYEALRILGEYNKGNIGTRSLRPKLGEPITIDIPPQDVNWKFLNELVDRYKEKEPIGTFVQWVDKEKGLALVKPFTPKEQKEVSKKLTDQKISEGFDMFKAEDYTHTEDKS